MNDLPTSQSAIIGTHDGEIGFASEVAVPALEDDGVLIKVEAVAVNPIDFKMRGPLCTAGAVAGMDFAGTVLAIGPNATPPKSLKIGDRVCTAVHGYHRLTPNIGAFSQYTCAMSHVTLKIPEHLSFEEGATLGTGIGTAGLAIFQSLQLPGRPSAPTDRPMQVLVYGGSTATGTLAIQVLKLSGYSPITTCSPANFDLVRSCGADHVFDYRSPTCIQDIRTCTRSSLKYALDCISEPETMQFCYTCIGRTGGKYTALEPFPAHLHTRPSVKPDWVLGPILSGKPIGWIPPFERPGDTEAKKFADGWFKEVQQLLDTGKLRPHPVRKMDGGLQGVLEGIELMQKKRVSGEKIVYRI